MSSHDRRFGAFVLFFVALFGFAGSLDAAETGSAAPALAVVAPAGGAPGDVLATIGSYTITRDEYNREFEQFMSSVNPQVKAHFETACVRPRFRNGP